MYVCKQNRQHILTLIYTQQLKSALHADESSSKTEPLTEVTVVTLPDCLDPINVGITLTESKDES